MEEQKSPVIISKDDAGNLFQEVDAAPIEQRIAEAYGGKEVHLAGKWGARPAIRVFREKHPEPEPRIVNGKREVARRLRQQEAAAAKRAKRFSDNTVEGVELE